jgi:HD-like signal output (HDOD) protein
MHNIGNLIIAHQLPQAYAECVQAARAKDRPYHALQQELLGFDYADVGAELLRQWNLPPALVQPVALHTHVIADVAATDQPFAGVMHIAAATARAAVWQDADSEPVPDYDATAVALTGTTEETIEDLMQRVDTEVSEFIAILMPNA